MYEFNKDGGSYLHNNQAMYMRVFLIFEDDYLVASFRGAGQSPGGVVANVTEFEFLWHYNVHFLTDILGKDVNSLK